ncbi:hypothetical protein OQ279_04380 [Salinimicrobium sp. MT39]|uniref:Uncharacterized protein n=1 Tax=Salinimicrobium profundisediminis TaxID=2994553 RepID=A0A9X3I0C2_9FLAO|nr:hypothetical protein [Salinimicrobium profundisediminis]MCX2837379.1 hypothetical protein [Salinimicrobium profundisediminis]
MKQQFNLNIDKLKLSSYYNPSEVAFSSTFSNFLSREFPSCIPGV